MSYGVELSGTNASWSFETGGLRIRYGDTLATHGLLRALGETLVSDAALAGVSVAAGRRKTVLQLRMRPGADPLLEAAAGQLPDDAHPYRLVLDAADKDLAEYYADVLQDRISLNPQAAEPAAEFLVSGPPPPRTLRGYDGQGTFDGRTVDFRWAWSGATSRKWSAGHQSYPVEQIEGVEWVAGGVLAGHLRLRLAGGQDGLPEIENDPAALIFGLGYGLIAESLPFAASVLAVAARRRAAVSAIAPAAVVAAETAAGPAAAPVGGHRARHRAEQSRQRPVREWPSAEPAEPHPVVPVPVPEPRPLASTPEDILNAIHRLGELHSAGVLTETEFERKKAELLRRL